MYILLPIILNEAKKENITVFLILHVRLKKRQIKNY